MSSLTKLVPCVLSKIAASECHAENAFSAERNVKQLMQQSKLEELFEKWQEQQFGTALSAVTIVR